MSIPALNWAVQQSAGSPAAKLILMLLADRADTHEGHEWSDGQMSCWPSQERLAAESEQSVDSVQRYLQKLADRGLITVERRKVPGRRRATNRYVLQISEPQSAANPNYTANEPIYTATSDDLHRNGDENYTATVRSETKLEPKVDRTQRLEPKLVGFSEFYKAYPRKKHPATAEKAWEKAVKLADPAVIIHGAVQFRQWCASENKDPRFIPHPSTWLNARAWEDERDPEPMNEHERRMEGWIALTDQSQYTEISYPQDNPLELEG